MPVPYAPAIAESYRDAADKNTQDNLFEQLVGMAARGDKQASNEIFKLSDEGDERALNRIRAITAKLLGGEPVAALNETEGFGPSTAPPTDTLRPN